MAAFQPPPCSVFVIKVIKKKHAGKKYSHYEVKEDSSEADSTKKIKK